MYQRQPVMTRHLQAASMLKDRAQNKREDAIDVWKESWV